MRQLLLPNREGTDGCTRSAFLELTINEVVAGLRGEAVTDFVVDCTPSKGPELGARPLAVDLAELAGLP